MPIDFVPDPDLYPFASRWHAGRSGRIHYVDEGEGRPILLLHGNPTWSFLWRHVIVRLRDRYRCVAPDYPGFGLSERPPSYGYTPAEHAVVVRELIEALDLEGLVVVGHDWGGPIGLAAAADLAPRVAGLAFSNTWFWPVDRWGLRLFGWAASIPPAGWALRRTNLFVGVGIPAGTGRHLSRREMEHYRAVQPDAAARVGVAELPRQIRRARPWLEALAHRVPRTLGTKPLLLAWGERDPVFPPGACLPRWKAAFADSEVLRLEAAGHFVPEDAPGRLAEAIAGRFPPRPRVVDPADG